MSRQPPPGRQKNPPPPPPPSGNVRASHKVENGKTYIVDTPRRGAPPSNSSPSAVPPLKVGGRRRPNEERMQPPPPQRGAKVNNNNPAGRVDRDLAAAVALKLKTQGRTIGQVETVETPRDRKTGKKKYSTDVVYEVVEDYVDPRIYRNNPEARKANRQQQQPQRGKPQPPMSRDPLRGRQQPPPRQEEPARGQQPHPRERGRPESLPRDPARGRQQAGPQREEPQRGQQPHPRERGRPESLPRDPARGRQQAGPQREEPQRQQQPHPRERGRPESLPRDPARGRQQAGPQREEPQRGQQPHPRERGRPESLSRDPVKTRQQAGSQREEPQLQRGRQQPSRLPDRPEQQPRNVLRGKQQQQSWADQPGPSPRGRQQQQQQQQQNLPPPNRQQRQQRHSEIQEPVNKRNSKIPVFERDNNLGRDRGSKGARSSQNAAGVGPFPGQRQGRSNVPVIIEEPDWVNKQNKPHKKNRLDVNPCNKRQQQQQPPLQAQGRQKGGRVSFNDSEYQPPGKGGGKRYNQAPQKQGGNFQNMFQEDYYDDDRPIVYKHKHKFVKFPYMQQRTETEKRRGIFANPPPDTQMVRVMHSSMSSQYLPPSMPIFIST